MPSYISVWTENNLKTELFANDDLKIVMDFPARGFLKHVSKITGECCVFKFLLRSVEGKDFENGAFGIVKCGPLR